MEGREGIIERRGGIYKRRIVKYKGEKERRGREGGREMQEGECETNVQ